MQSGKGCSPPWALEMDPGTRIFTTLPVVSVPEMPVVSLFCLGNMGE